MDANEFAAQVAAAANLVMNAASLADKVAIDRADDDAGVRTAIAMQGNEVLAVQRQNRTPFADRVIENRLVRNGQARLVRVV